MENQPLLSQSKISIRRPLLASFLASVLSFASGTVVGGGMDPLHPEKWVVSIYLVGALLGALPAGQLSRTKGRKEFLMWLAIPMTVGWLLIILNLQLFEDNVYLILAGRFLCGLSVGAVTVAVPLYNYDVTPNVCRGRGGVFPDFMLCAGMLYSYVFRSLLGLRMFALTCAVIPLVFCALFWHMPESPLYLFSRGRYVDARSALKWLHGNECDDSAVFAEYAKLQTEDDAFPFHRDPHAESSVTRKRAFVKAIVLSLALATVQNMSCAGAILQYTVKFVQISGWPDDYDKMLILTGAFQLIGSVIAIFLVDRVGRQKLLLISSAAVGVCLAVFTSFFYFLNNDSSTTNGRMDSVRKLDLLKILLFMSTLFFRLGLGPIPWFITTELIGADHSNRAHSYIVSCSWILSLVVMKTFDKLFDKWPMWLGFTAIMVVGYTFILFFIPETNNKSPNEIRLSLA